MLRRLQRPRTALPRLRSPISRVALRRLGSALLLAMSLSLATAPVAAAPAAAPAPTKAAEGRPEAGSAAIWRPGVRDPARGLPGRWERELARREAILRRGGPQAILGLTGLVEELGGEIDDARLVALLEGVVAGKRQDPLVRAHARYLLGRVAEARGDRQGARAHYSAAGFLLDWQVVGPFDNAGRAGHQQVYEPETAPWSPNQDFRAGAKLKTEALAWQRVDYEHAPRAAYVALDDRLHPNTQATGYATVWVKVPKATAAAIHLGTSGPHAVWVNGDLVGDGDTYRIADPLQEAHGFTLEAGVNRILIKMSCDDGPWGFFARLSDGAGAPLKGVEILADGPGPSGQVPSGPAKATRAPRSLRALIDARAERKGAKGAELLDRAEFERWTHPFEAGDRTPALHARQADEAAQSARSAWLLAAADPDPGGSRSALMRGIERARAEGPGGRQILASMLLDLAWRDRSIGLDRRFRERLQEAREAAPDDAEIELVAAATLAEDGFALTTLAWIKDLARRYPESTMIRRELADRLLDLGRVPEGLAMLEALRNDGHGDSGVSRRMIEVLVDLGRQEEATALARERVKAAPGLPEAHRDLARLDEGRGDLDAAQASIAEALRLAPHDASHHAALGRVQARAGLTTLAVASLRRSLDLRPQQPELRDLLSTLEPRGDDDLFARYAVDLEEVAKRPTPKDLGKNKSAATLHRRLAIRVLDNGLSERLDHRIIRVLDDRGITGQAAQDFVFDPHESYVEVRRARVRKKDGSVVEAAERGALSLGSAGDRMYYDMRLQRVAFPGLQVGDVLEVAVVRRDVAARNKFDDYFGELMAIDASEPQAYVDLVIEAPASRPLHFNRKVKKTASKDGKTVTYRYTARDLKGVRAEANMPGWTEIARYLHVSTYESWDAVGRWYWGLVREQLQVDKAIKAGVAQAIAGLPPEASERDKVAAIYKHVIESTRYVGLEFGIHGFKPYRTTDVYDRRFGDCKDKASLLKVMLAEVGIPSYLTLVRTRDQGTIGKTPASLAAFNHAIVYVPGLDLYLDGTAEFSGPSELPFGDQGATVLVVKDGQGAELRTIPRSLAADNLEATTQTITLASDGSAILEHALQVHGAGASRWRSALQSATRRKETLAGVWGRAYPGVAIESVEVAGVDDVLRPVSIRARLKVPEFARAQEGVLRVPVLGSRVELVRTMAAEAQREHDLVLTSAAVEETTIELRAPGGFAFLQAPASAALTSPHGSFRLDVAADGGKATVTCRLEFTASRIPAAEYPAFREFLRKVESSLAGSFELGRAR